MWSRMRRALGRSLAGYLARESGARGADLEPPVERLAALLQPADVLLVEGSSRFSSAIKYLTNSNWSHAALYVGPVQDPLQVDIDTPWLLEADVLDGVTLVPLRKYGGWRTRICRPSGLDKEGASKVVVTALSRLGQSYDLGNIVDLVRYLVTTPPVPAHLRRRMLALGSGEPTQAICSALIAHAFQSVRYPILPLVEQGAVVEGGRIVDEILHIRHHRLFTPRDFDLSPYFRIVKPALEGGFDPRTLRWAGADAGASRPP